MNDLIRSPPHPPLLHHAHLPDSEAGGVVGQGEGEGGAEEGDGHDDREDELLEAVQQGEEAPLPAGGAVHQHPHGGALHEDWTMPKC